MVLSAILISIMRSCVLPLFVSNEFSRDRATLKNMVTMIRIHHKWQMTNDKTKHFKTGCMHSMASTTRFFVQQLIQADINENIYIPHLIAFSLFSRRPFVRGIHRGRWIPLTKGLCVLCQAVIILMVLPVAVKQHGNNQPTSSVLIGPLLLALSPFSMPSRYQKHC